MEVQRIRVAGGYWLIDVYYAPKVDQLVEVAAALIDAGDGVRATAKALHVLRRKNTGYTYTNYDKRVTVAVVSDATSLRQFANTLEHELKHIVEHISTYYGVNPKSEEAGYLQGYIGGRILEFIISALAHAGGCGRSLNGSTSYRSRQSAGRRVIRGSERG